MCCWSTSPPITSTDTRRVLVSRSRRLRGRRDGLSRPGTARRPLQSGASGRGGKRPAVERRLHDGAARLGGRGRSATCRARSASVPEPEDGARIGRSTAGGEQKQGVRRGGDAPCRRRPRRDLGGGHLSPPPPSGRRPGSPGCCDASWTRSVSGGGRSHPDRGARWAGVVRPPAGRQAAALLTHQGPLRAGDKVIVDDASVVVERADRIRLSGRNGAASRPCCGPWSKRPTSSPRGCSSYRKSSMRAAGQGVPSTLQRLDPASGVRCWRWSARWAPTRSGYWRPSCPHRVRRASCPGLGRGPPCLVPRPRRAHQSPGSSLGRAAGGCLGGFCRRHLAGNPR